MEKIVIIGATSGIGASLARQLLEAGYKVGIAGRRMEKLEELHSKFPETSFIEQVDVRDENAPKSIESLINKMGGIDTFVHSSGIGWENPELGPEYEIETAKTNVEGFVRTSTYAFNYFKNRGEGGHIAVISSIADTKMMGTSAAYSATKRFQAGYLAALSQLSHMTKSKIKFTDIKPGFVDTPLIENKNYPGKMTSDYCARLIIKALKRKKRVAYIDWKFKLLVAVWRLIPRCIWERMTIKGS